MVMYSGVTYLLETSLWVSLHVRFQVETLACPFGLGGGDVLTFLGVLRNLGAIGLQCADVFGLALFQA